MSGILFNHESPRRGASSSPARSPERWRKIKLGLQDELRLGNLDAKRDWGFAAEYVEAMWLMLQQDQPDDYVVATGGRHSVREFAEQTFGLLDLDLATGTSPSTSATSVRSGVELLEGDATKAQTELGWSPRVGFPELIEMMVESDLALATEERALVDAGLRTIEWTPRRSD